MGHNGPSQQQTGFVYFYCFIYLTFTYFEYSHKVNLFLSRNWNLMMKKKKLSRWLIVTICFPLFLEEIHVVAVIWSKEQSCLFLGQAKEGPPG